LKKKGDTALRGEPIVEYTVGRSREIRVITAPYDLTLGFLHVEYWDNAEVGQTLAEIIPTAIPGSANSPPAQQAPGRR